VRAFRVGGYREHGVNSSRTTPLRSRPFAQVWKTLAAIGAGALIAFLVLWLGVNPAPTDLAYELAKTCLQIVGITVIGGVITAATSSAQQTRQEDAEALERQREIFGIRASLLDRATRCAERMFITCQHVRRLKADATPRDAKAPSAAEAQELLDREYLEFSTESKAIETELGARFQERWSEGDGLNGEAFLRWHQMRDLLTVYYFDLCERFRKDILDQNSAGQDGKMHSGIDFFHPTKVVNNPNKPTPLELEEVRGLLRAEYKATVPKFAKAVLREEIRDL
jgi:hypothetical protein